MHKELGRHPRANIPHRRATLLPRASKPGQPAAHRRAPETTTSTLSFKRSPSSAASLAARRGLPADRVEVLLRARHAAVERDVDLRDVHVGERVDELLAVELVVGALGREDLVLFFQSEVRPRERRVDVFLVPARSRAFVFASPALEQGRRPQSNAARISSNGLSSSSARRRYSSRHSLCEIAPGLPARRASLRRTQDIPRAGRGGAAAGTRRFRAADIPRGREFPGSPLGLVTEVVDARELAARELERRGQ